ncbi:heavy-metal-associated domain-containing protein [Selenomonas noxia]|jgi:cadmium-exporting ATPase|uniref:heavy-metal-associated domain-containing protein n=1 Tax=Selenomonas noxia TaxID=135083 RepID=UPI0028801BC2|nr:cation transporter [Selenomonas noxia]
MKKAFKIRELDCAHCAQEIEEAASKVAGVNKVRINFLSERMTLDAEDARFDAVLDEIKKIVKTIEPDAVLEA